MKKVLITSILILAIISSLLAGTVSYYTTSIDNLAGGSVTAKEFIFLGEGTQSFIHSEAIAPSETVEWSFKVRNYKESTVTETDQYYKLNIDVTNADGKEAIKPLQVTITDESGKEHTVTGTGSFSILGDFPIKTTGQEHDYKVIMHWPSGDNDIDFAGNGFGNSVKVSAIASQVPFDSETQPVEPEEPGEPGEGEGPGEPTEGDIHITYRTTTINFENGSDRYEFSMVVKNNTDEQIDGWRLKFLIPNANKNLLAQATLESAQDGNFIFASPANYNRTIGAGEYLQHNLSGHFISEDGKVHTPKNMTLYGMNVDKEFEVTVEHIRDTTTTP